MVNGVSDRLNKLIREVCQEIQVEIMPDHIHLILEVNTMKTFQFKLYQTDKNAKLHLQINCAGLTYNHCVALHKSCYKLFGKYLKKDKLQKHLTKLKKVAKFSCLKILVRKQCKM